MDSVLKKTLPLSSNNLVEGGNCGLEIVDEVETAVSACLSQQ